MPLDKLFPKRAKREADALDKCVAALSLVEADPLYKTEGNPTRGKCYYASVALWVYLGGVSAGYQLRRSVDELGTHYWVETPGGRFLDPTSEQFKIMEKEPPYILGKRVSVRPNFTKYLPILEAMYKCK